MDGGSAKKSTSLETLVIQNITNVNDLKTKLSDIIEKGKDYDFDVSSCLKSLLKNSDHEIVLLTVQAISELAKCEEKRGTYAHEDIIKPLINILQKDLTSETIELIKQSCRALGNLCCDCDTARKIILDNKGVETLISLLEKSLPNRCAEEIKMFTIKILSNYAIGGQEFSESIVQGGLMPLLHKILTIELEKEDMNDNMVSTTLSILNVVNENTLEFLFEPEVNIAVLNILKETANLEISELCLDHLLAQAEHEEVKTLLAKENGVQLVCGRLEQLVQCQEAGDLRAEDSEVEAVVKQACDLIVIVLTGEEAVHLLYNKGSGEVYITMVKWLDSNNHHLLTTAVLAIANFARQDDYCIQMMEENIFDKLLDIFETHHAQASGGQRGPMAATAVQHAALAALRNLLMPSANKRRAGARGRAAPLLLRALPAVEQQHVAYKLLAALRMLVDGQEAAARQLCQARGALAAVARWGRAAEHPGAAGEAPRLLAWAVKSLRGAPHWRNLVEVEGCLYSLINMLIVCHTVMQNEGVLALTLLAIESLKPQDSEFDYEKSFITQLVNSEIGKHVSVLVETNCAKMPVEVAENLLAFLDITSKKNELAKDYKEAKVPEALQKFMDSRKDLSDDLKSCIVAVVATISDNELYSMLKSGLESDFMNSKYDLMANEAMVVAAAG